MKLPRMTVAILVLLASGRSLTAETHDRLSAWVVAEGDEVEPAMAKEVVKRIEERDKWFSIAGDRETADIVVTLRRQWKEKKEKKAYQWQRPVTGNNAGAYTRLSEIPEIEDVLFLDAEIRIGEALPAVVTVNGRRAKDVGSALAKELEKRCKESGPKTTAR
jgi:hypothetical protein